MKVKTSPLAIANSRGTMSAESGYEKLKHRVVSWITEEQMPIHCPRRQGNNVLTYMERQKKGILSHFTVFQFHFKLT